MISYLLCRIPFNWVYDTVDDGVSYLYYSLIHSLTHRDTLHGARERKKVHNNVPLNSDRESIRLHSGGRVLNFGRRCSEEKRVDGGFEVGGEIVRFEIVRFLGWMKVACDGRRRKVGIISGWAGIALAADSVSSMVNTIRNLYPKHASFPPLNSMFRRSYPLSLSIRDDAVYFQGGVPVWQISYGS